MGRRLAVVALALLALAPVAHASEPVGKRFPPGFPELLDHSLQAADRLRRGRPATRTPVSSCTATTTHRSRPCNPHYGFTHNLAQYLHDRATR